MRMRNYPYIGRTVIETLPAVCLPSVSDEAELEIRIPQPPAMELGHVRHVAAPVKETVRANVTRKKNGLGGEPRLSDLIGWNGTVFLLRFSASSPWLTVAEREEAITKLIQSNAVFDTRRGFKVIGNPPQYEGTGGWQTEPRHRRYRKFVRYLQGQWVKTSRMSDDY